MIIKTVGQLRELIRNIEDDYTIEVRIRTRVSDEELAKRNYPYPFDTEYKEGFEYDDIGVSDKVLCIGVERSV